jgi:hypothetical protein
MHHGCASGFSSRTAERLTPLRLWDPRTCSWSGPNMATVSAGSRDILPLHGAAYHTHCLVSTQEKCGILPSIASVCRIPACFRWRVAFWQLLRYMTCLWGETKMTRLCLLHASKRKAGWNCTSFRSCWCLAPLCNRQYCCNIKVKSCALKLSRPMCLKTRGHDIFSVSSMILKFE